MGKCSPKQKRKQAQIEQIISCAESQMCPPFQPQSTNLDAVVTPEGIHKQFHEDVILKKDGQRNSCTSNFIANNDFRFINGIANKE